MKINEDFLKKVEKKYEEMINSHIDEDYLDEDIFGKIKVFINKKPKHFLFSTTVKLDKVYVGSESL